MSKRKGRSNYIGGDMGWAQQIANEMDKVI